MVWDTRIAHVSPLRDGPIRRYGNSSFLVSEEMHHVLSLLLHDDEDTLMDEGEHTPSHPQTVSPFLISQNPDAKEIQPMTAIERTAYRQLQRTYGAHDLSTLFTPTVEERWFAEMTGRTTQLRFTLLVLLKCFHYLGYFPALDAIPDVLITHVRACMGYTAEETPFHYDSLRTLYRHHALVREHLGVTSYGKAARHCAAVAIRTAALTQEQPADLINAALEQLIKEDYELPAFLMLDRLAHRIRILVNTHLYQQIGQQLTEDMRARLDALLVVGDDQPFSDHARLKKRPENVTPSHITVWEQQVTWLTALAETTPLLASISTTKRERWALEARSLDAPTTAALVAPKRYALVICLIHEEQMAARDALVQMFLRAIAGLHATGKDALVALHTQQRQSVDALVATLDGIACEHLEEGAQPDDARFGELVRTYLGELGGADAVHAQCQAFLRYRGNNYLPLLPACYATARATLFKIVRTLAIHPSSSDTRVARALTFLRANAHRKGKLLETGIELSFASEDWQRLILTRDPVTRERRFDRHALELCIFSAVADDLKTGDLWVEGAGEFADLRAQMIPRTEVPLKSAAYCTKMNLPLTAREFVQQLKDLLSTTAQQIDQGIPTNTALEFTAKGKVVLKRRRKPKVAQQVLALEAALLEEMPVRSVLEGLRNVQHWTNFTQSFGPLSGAEPKMADPLPKYLLTVFGYGTNLGPAQLARHVSGTTSAQAFGRINARHISAEGLDREMKRIIDTYYRCELPHVWGSAKVASADGTMQELHSGNLMTEYHVRYGRFGGIAFHYVSSLYIALVSHFIPCGAWEGIYLIDAYLHNTSLVQPDTIHTDTQGQSAPIFGMAYLLGINLMPRIRNWRSITLYRPEHTTTYAHIDALFTATVDWPLIERSWEDLLQAMISIQEGKILPSTLLRKLSNYSRKNKLYQAFKAVGDVVRTIFLLNYIATMEMREMITQETNKVEAYNGFTGWVSFGGDGVLSGMDDDTFTKRIKYTDVLANALILHNIVDMTVALAQLQQRGYVVAPETVAHLSPYMTRNWRRFGEYSVDMATTPPSLESLVGVFAPMNNAENTA